MNGVLAVWNDCVAGHEDDYEQWYLREHLLERLAVPGFMNGYRYENPQATPRYFTYSETESPEVLSSPAYLALPQNPSPWTQRIMQNAFRNVTRAICKRSFAIGRLSGSHVVCLRWQDAAVPDAIQKEIAQKLFSGGVVRVQFWSAIDASGAATSTEARARGGRDAGIGGALVVDCARKGDAEDVLAKLGEISGRLGLAGPVESGVYSLICTGRANPAAQSGHPST